MDSGWKGKKERNTFVYPSKGKGFFPLLFTLNGNHVPTGGRKTHYDATIPIHDHPGNISSNIRGRTGELSL
jgi:hypothetical protein